MKKRTIPEPEIRLTLLYVLSRFESMSDLQLLRFLTDTEIMGYMDMQLGLSSLGEQQMVCFEDRAGARICAVTEAGRAALDSMQGTVPLSTREKIDVQAPVWQARFEFEKQTPAETIELSGGAHSAHLRLLEGDLTLMDIMIKEPGDTRWSFLQQRWRAAAEKIYAQTMGMLCGGFDENERIPDPDESREQNGALVQLIGQSKGGGRWMLFAEEPDGFEKGPAFSLMLTLPDEKLARHAAAIWPETAKEVRAMICAALDGWRG